MNTPAPSRRSLWPLAIIGFFIVFATFLTSFIVWAVGQKQDLVAENYYEKEVRFQEQLDRQQRTQALAKETVVQFNAATRTILVALPDAQAREVKGQIHFYRPANARLDQTVPLSTDPTGRQAVDARSLAAGLWKVRVEWSASGQDFYFDQPVIVN